MYEACVGSIQPSDNCTSHPSAQLRYHYVKVDGNGHPKVTALATALVDHITYYCIASTQRKDSLPAHKANALFRRARDLFRKQDTAGEPGELLLCFLLESVLKAPQIVCKMDLKTNPKDEVKGSDGIHIQWSREDDVLTVYLGESKLYKSYGAAIDDAIASIGTFHDNKQQDRELQLVTSQFKIADEDLKERVARYLDERDPIGTVRIVHACLIGFSWSKYAKLQISPDDFSNTFTKKYAAHTEKLAKRIHDALSGFKYKHLKFEVFFLPFPCVQEFRNEFNRALSGQEKA